MNVLIPTGPEFVEIIAKEIGKDRLYRDAASLIETQLGIDIKDVGISKRFDIEFERLWNGKDEESVWTRESYIADATTAINKINLMLLTMTQ